MRKRVSWNEGERGGRDERRTRRTGYGWLIGPNFPFNFLSNATALQKPYYGSCLQLFTHSEHNGQPSELECLFPESTLPLFLASLALSHWSRAPYAAAPIIESYITFQSHWQVPILRSAKVIRKAFGTAIHHHIVCMMRNFPSRFGII
jgi:hypothetical protein